MVPHMDTRALRKSIRFLKRYCKMNGVQIARHLQNVKPRNKRKRIAKAMKQEGHGVVYTSLQPQFLVSLYPMTRWERVLLWVRIISEPGEISEIPGVLEVV